MIKQLEVLIPLLFCISYATNKIDWTRGEIGIIQMQPIQRPVYSECPPSIEYDMGRINSSHVRVGEPIPEYAQEANKDDQEEEK